jgi:hypothetical protein
METDVEQWARDEIDKAGGWLIKFTSPGTRGPPDDICLWPGKILHFIEFKFDEEEPNQLQVDYHRNLARFGHTVRILKTREAVTRYIRSYGDPR